MRRPKAEAQSTAADTKRAPGSAGALSAKQKLSDAARSAAEVLVAPVEVARVIGGPEP